MDLASSPTTILETEIKLEGTNPMHNSRATMELHNSNHEAIGVFLPEKTPLTLDDRLIDIRSSPLAGMMTITTGIAKPNPAERNLAEHWNQSTFSFWSETSLTAESTISALAV